MKKASIVSAILIVSLLVGVQKAFSSPKTINYGFVQTLDVLALPDTTTGKPKFTTGFCVEFLEKLKNATELKKQYKFIEHAIANQGRDVGGLSRPTYQGLKDKLLDSHCGAMRPYKKIPDPSSEGLIFSKPFLVSEAKALLFLPQESTSSNFSDIQSLDDVGKWIKDGNHQVGVLKGNEPVELILNFHNISYAVYDNEEMLENDIAKGEIVGIVNDTLHIDDFIKKAEINSLRKVLKRGYVILPSPSSTTVDRQNELMTYSFAFRMDGHGRELKDLINDYLEKPNFSVLKDNLENIRKEINNKSGKIQPSPNPSPAPSPDPSPAILKHISALLKHISGILSSSFELYLVEPIFNVLLALAVFLVIPLSNSAKQKVIDAITDLLIDRIKSWLKPNSPP